MPEGLEQIIVEYKLDLSTLKQQFEQIKTEMHGLKGSAESSSKEAGESVKKHIGKGVDDTRESFKALGTEIKLVLGGAQVNEAARHIHAVNTGAQKAIPEIAALKKALDAVFTTPQAQAGTINKVFDDIKSRSEQAIQVLGSVTHTVFSNALNKLKTEFEQAQAQLGSWQQRAMQAADGNAKKQAAIERVYHAEQLKLAHEKAVKEAEIARKQAEVNKAQKLVEILVQTAVNVTKYTGGLPESLPLLAAATAEGAAQAAAVAAAPLPPIPKFATGVVGFKGRGSETSDSNPVFISHNESIITAAATKKYGAELEAINSLHFENLVLEKYLLPALKNTGATNMQNTAYDDWLLRKEIREGNHLNKKSVKYLETIAGSVKFNNLLNNRYS